MNKELSILDIDRVVQVLQRRCESMDITLTWSKSARTANTNGRNITLPLVSAPVTKEAMDKLHGFVIHEAGHHSRPDAFGILNALESPPEALCALFNIAEDDGMEREVASRHLGDTVALGRQNNVVLGELAKEFKDREWPEDLTEQDIAPLSVCALAQLSRMEWDGQSTVSRAQYMNSLPTVAKDLLDDLAKEGWVDRLLATKDPHDCWDLACDLYKRIYPEQDEEEQGEQPNDSNGDSETDTGGSGNDSTAGSPSQQPLSEEQVEDHRAKGHSMQPSSKQNEGGTKGSGEGTGDEGKDGTPPPDAKGQVVSWKDFVLSEHNEWQAKDPNSKAGTIGIDWTDYKRGEVGFMPYNEINVIDCRTNEQTPEDEGGGWGMDAGPSAFMPDNAQARAFSNRVRRYLQAKKRTKVRRERYHGRLDKSSIVKLALPPIDGGEYNKKLFYDMDREVGKDTCIHVLTDWSGSMEGDKMVYAADASGRLVQCFDRILHMPVQLAAFTNGHTRCDIGLIKSFRDRSMSPLDIATAFSRFYKFSSANNDGDSVMWAYNQLLRRKEERKILIVLSDGCPAGSYMGSGSTNLKHITSKIEKEGKVELYGVGICSDAVATYYSNYKVLEGPDEINQTLFEVIKGGTK